jgi:hypothetical protein
VLDVMFVNDDTLEHIIERLVVLLQVNVVVYIRLKVPTFYIKDLAMMNTTVVPKDKLIAV